MVIHNNASSLIFFGFLDGRPMRGDRSGLNDWVYQILQRLYFLTDKKKGNHNMKSSMTQNVTKWSNPMKR